MALKIKHMTQTTKTTTATLNELALFRAAQAESIRKILAKARKKTFRKNELLFLEGDRLEHNHIVLNGHIKIFKETESGEEVVHDIYKEGDTLISFLEDDIAAYNAVAIENSEVLIIPSPLMNEILAHDPALSKNLIEYLKGKHWEKNKEIENRILLESAQRLGCFILSQCKSSQDNQVIKFPYEKNIIAQTLGMRPETFSRSLIKLGKETGLTISGNNITIEKHKALRDYCCSFCTDSYPCKKLQKNIDRDQ
jgi:CRP-like cAMP-binding protein